VPDFTTVGSLDSLVKVVRGHVSNRVGYKKKLYLLVGWKVDDVESKVLVKNMHVALFVYP
jgi:hypothetical protein